MLITVLSYALFSGKVRAVRTEHPPTVRIQHHPIHPAINPAVPESGERTGGGVKRDYDLQTTPVSDDTLVSDFEAIPYTGWFPPDPQIAVGMDHVIVAVNGGLRIFSKTGSTLYNNTLEGFFAPIYPGHGDLFDPKVAYDVLAHRWYVLALYANYSPDSSFYYLAVSATDDPTAGWLYYKLDATLDGSTPTSNLADYPGLGFNDKWLVITSNQFTFSWSYRYGKVRVLNKSEVLSGTISGWTDFYGSDLGSYSYTIKPTRSISPSGELYLVKRMDPNELYVWKITGTSSSPSLSSRITLYISSFSTTDSVPQMGTSTKLEAGDFFGVLGATLYNGKIYLTFGETHPLDATLSSARLVILNTVPSVIEDISLYENDMSWLYPYVGVSPKGLVVVFTRVGRLHYPSVYYVARRNGETSFSPPRRVKDGLTWYVLVYNDRNRWGDYFGAAMDPSDSSVWFVGEYSFTHDEWSTWVGKVDWRTTARVVERWTGGGLKCRRCTVYDVLGRKANLHHPGVFFIREGKRIRKVVILR